MQVSRSEGPRPGLGPLGAMGRPVQQHAQLETTTWSAPAHSYGKVVAGLAMVDGAGRAVSARKQVEVLSARAPGVLRVLRATHTHSHSSTHHHFDDLKLSVNPLNINPQKDRSNVGRSGALGGRRPPTRVRGGPAPTTNSEDSQAKPEDPFRLVSPSIVAGGSSKIHRNETISDFNIVEMRSESDDKSTNDTKDNVDAVSTYKVNFPDNNSEESFYDSCPEKESVFKDETEQLEEWRRTSKIRRSLQFPRRSTTFSSKPLDLPDNWGSVSRIRQELENCQRLITVPNPVKDEPNSADARCNGNEEPMKIIDTLFGKDVNGSIDNFTIKPSALKTKTFITLETLNDVRGRLKSLSEKTVHENDKSHGGSDSDDGIDAEDSNSSKVEETVQENIVTPANNVRSYVFGMEAKINSANEYKQAYSCGTNSLESRVSKLANAAASRNDDWYARRKSYGFEKVQKNINSSLSSHEKDYIESSTDSGICHSSEIVNSISNSMINSDSSSTPKYNSNRTLVTLGNLDKTETFEDWLVQNRKSFLTNIQNEKQQNKYNHNADYTSERDKYGSLKTNSDDTNSLKIPIKPDDNTSIYSTRPTFFKKTSDTSSTGGDFQNSLLKRHTIAVDGIKDIKEFYEPKISHEFRTANKATIELFSKTDDNSEERKSKKVEFCKTEVHFAAESGRVNIVETDGKPPSSNNFRRRRRNSNGTPSTPKETEVNKSNLPVMHFGDSPKENLYLGASTNDSTNEELKLNYAVITEIKSSQKEAEKPTESTDNAIVNQNSVDDASDDQPRGILKNKPVKPRPYHLGEDRQIVPDTQKSDQNMWGVKLRPVSLGSETPLWRSSVAVKSNAFNETSNQQIINSESQSNMHIVNTNSSVNQIIKPTSGSEKVFFSDKTSNESKGYHTKVNIGNDNNFVDISCKQKMNLSNIDAVSIGNIQQIKRIDNSNNDENKYVSSPKHWTMPNRKTNPEEKQFTRDDDERKNMRFGDDSCIKKSVSASNDRMTRSFEDTKSNLCLKTTFADTLSTPRALMPGRGSARKLRDHEFSYFGIKPPEPKVEEPKKNAPETNYTNGNYKQQESLHQSQKNEYKSQTRSLDRRHIENEQPIYENIHMKDRKAQDSHVKPKHPGETIIEELTKAADEILNALNGYSDEDSAKHSTEEDEEVGRRKNGKNFIKSIGLATISENKSHKKSKALENKAVQTSFNKEKVFNYSSLNQKSKIRTSSNSSIESLPRDHKMVRTKKSSAIVENGIPEKPSRRKISSGEVTKARRLQRATSRDALLQIHGSSSEDLAGHLEVVRKKSVKRSKQSDITKSSSKTSLNNQENNSLVIEYSSEQAKSSNKSISSALPEIRHKTAVSTIKSVGEKHSRRERSTAEKPKHSSNRERSRHRDKIMEGTISSQGKERPQREKSRSADASLDREHAYNKERSSREVLYRKSAPRLRDKSSDGDRHMRKIIELTPFDAEKRKKSSSVVKTSGSTGISPPDNGVHRSKVSDKPTPDRHARLPGKTTSGKTERDRSLR